MSSITGRSHLNVVTTRHSCQRRAGTVLLVVGLSCLAAAGVGADVVLEIDERTVMDPTLVGQGLEETTRSTVFVGPERARVDRGETSMVLREDLGKLWWVHHPSREYREIDLPVELEAYVPEESKATAAELFSELAANAELENRGQVEQVGPWSTQRWRVHVVFPLVGSIDEYELWLATDLDYDLGSYKALLRAINALEPRMRSWYGKVADLHGVVVRSEARKGSGQTREVMVTRELKAVTEREVPGTLYEVPPEYRRVEFRFDVKLNGPS